MSSGNDRVALVTGAARGIGAATVMALAAYGWRVVAVDRCADDPALPYPLGTRAELDAVVAQAGPGAFAAEADTRDGDALAAVIAKAERRWGGLDAAVAAAGVIAGGEPAWQVPPAPAGSVRERLAELSGVLVQRDPPTLLGPATPAEAAKALLDFLRKPDVAQGNP